METSVAQSPQILVDRPAPLETRERVPVEGSIREIAEGGGGLTERGGTKFAEAHDRDLAEPQAHGVV